MKIDQEAIKRLCLAICELKEDIKAISKMKLPRRPETKGIIKFGEYEQYKQEHEEYKKAKIEQEHIKPDKEARLATFEQELRNMIPLANTWFITDDEKYAIGYETNDWPTGQPTTYCIENPVIKDLKDLKHRIIN